MFGLTAFRITSLSSESWDTLYLLFDLTSIIYVTTKPYTVYKYKMFNLKIRVYCNQKL